MDIKSIYEQIGYAGVALILCAFAALYIGIRTLIYMQIVWRQFKNKFLNKQLNNKDDVIKACDGINNPLMSIIKDIVSIHVNHSEDIRSEVAYLFHRNFEHISKSLTWLRLISVISPLLGLLGTVLGMVSVFQVIATDGSPDSAVLAGGIWEAMITTVMGLTVAIPVLVLYYYLFIKFKAFHIEAVEHSYRVIELCKNRQVSHEA